MKFTTLSTLTNALIISTVTLLSSIPAASANAYVLNFSQPTEGQNYIPGPNQVVWSIPKDNEILLGLSGNLYLVNYNHPKLNVLQIDVPVKAGQYSVIYPEQYYGVFGKAEPTDKFFIIFDVRGIGAGGESFQASFESGQFGISGEAGEGGGSPS